MREQMAFQIPLLYGEKSETPYMTNKTLLKIFWHDPWQYSERPYRIVTVEIGNKG